jgi:hypothetical protein
MFVGMAQNHGRKSVKELLRTNREVVEKSKRLTKAHEKIIGQIRKLLDEANIALSKRFPK